MKLGRGSNDSTFRSVRSNNNNNRPCPNWRLRPQLRLGRARLPFFNTDRRAGLAVAVAEVADSDTAISKFYTAHVSTKQSTQGAEYIQTFRKIAFY